MQYTMPDLEIQEIYVKWSFFYVKWSNGQKNTGFPAGISRFDRNRHGNLKQFFFRPDGYHTMVFFHSFPHIG